MVADSKYIQEVVENLKPKIDRELKWYEDSLKEELGEEIPYVCNFIKMFKSNYRLYDNERGSCFYLLKYERRRKKIKLVQEACNSLVSIINHDLSNEQRFEIIGNAHTSLEILEGNIPSLLARYLDDLFSVFYEFCCPDFGEPGALLEEAINSKTEEIDLYNRT